MTKSKTSSDLAKRLHSLGLRKSVAVKAADAADRARTNPTKAVKSLVGQLRELTGEIETRVTGGPGKAPSKTTKSKTAKSSAKPERKRSAKPKRSATKSRPTAGSGSRGKSRN